VNNDLNFRKAYTPPAGDHVDLNFTLNPDGVSTSAAIQLVKSAPTLRIAVDAEKPHPVTAALTMTLHTKQTLSVRVNYANNVQRGPSHVSTQRYETAAPMSPAKSSFFEQAVNLKPIDTLAWAPPTHVRSRVQSLWKQAVRQRVYAGVRHEEAAPATTYRVSGWKYAPHLRRAPGVSYEAATALRRLTGDSFEYPPHIKVAKTLPTEEAQLVTRPLRVMAGTARHLKRATRLPWEDARQPAYGVEPSFPPVKPPPQYVGDGNAEFICPWLDYSGHDILLTFGKYPCKDAEPQQPAGTVIVPVKKVYIVINNVLLRRVDGNVELPTFSLSLSIDADSWTWGFNAALPAAAQDVVEPGSDGTPVELEAVINGTAYRVLAENISRDRSFGQAVIRVAGKGKSGMLGAPYAPILNFGNTQARTAQQLMNDALTINGASIGWTVNWALTDWLVPAGAWAHQGTYITALNAIAEAAGGYIQPHATQKQLNVLARYPTAPWNWGSLAPDFELPSDVTTREGIEWLERPRYNRVFATGEAQGVLGQVTRAGTAGDILAPLVTDALITHADAARQRGLAVLADTGRQAHLSLRLPVLAETGVIQPGKFVRYVEGGTTRIGIVRSTAIEVGMPEVWQTIGVETHVA
jgi:hypothetical protein